MNARTSSTRISLALTAILLVGILPPDTLAHHGLCAPPHYSHLGAYTAMQSGVSAQGSRGTLEYDDPSLCNATFSTVWTMAWSTTGAGLVQAGYFKSNTAEPNAGGPTDFFFE